MSRIFFHVSGTVSKWFCAVLVIHAVWTTLSGFKPVVAREKASENVVASGFGGVSVMPAVFAWSLLAGQRVVSAPRSSCGQVMKLLLGAKALVFYRPARPGPPRPRLASDFSEQTHVVRDEVREDFQAVSWCA
jgi:hypothetical protein